MRVKKWTIKYGTDKKLQIKDSFLLKNINGLCNSCFITFKQGECLILLNIDIGDYWEGKSLLEEVAFGEAEIIADMLSWRYDIPLRNKGIYSGNPKRIKTSSQKVLDARFSYKEIFSGKVSEENLEILAGYRQIKNERSPALKYLMYYRLLEMLARAHKASIDKLLYRYKLRTKFIKDPRHPNRVKSLIRHIRDKVHATKISYKFPYRALTSHLGEIGRITRTVITEIIST